MREEYQSNSSHVELINLDEVYGVTKIGPNTYRGNRPLTKPDRRSRGFTGKSLWSSRLSCHGSITTRV